MIIRFYREDDKDRWDHYVLDHPCGTFFHLSGWKRVLERSFGHRPFYLIAETGGDVPTGKSTGKSNGENTVTGVFPLFMVKSFLFGNSLVSAPYATKCGILANDHETELALYRKAVEITDSENLDYLEIRNEKRLPIDLPVKELYYNFKREISSNDEENLKAIPRKARRMVRVGMSNGLEPVFGRTELLPEFYDLFAYNFRSYGTPVFSIRYIRNLVEEFGNASILVVRKDGLPLSGVLSFFFRDEVIPYYSGAYPAAREHAANDFLYWSLMTRAVSLGCHQFDFGRSKKDTGPFRFKKHWGFEPTPLPYQFYLHRAKEMPNEDPTNPKYHYCIELWKKLPMWVTKSVGPHIVKYIP